jgi:hypothetical protein
MVEILVLEYDEVDVYAAVGYRRDAGALVGRVLT